MTINTTTVEASLQTALDATTGTTAAKDLLLLSKAVEALTPVGGSTPLPAGATIAKYLINS